jgi:hypothetical protein
MTGHPASPNERPNMDRVGRREQHARQGAPRMVGEPVQTARPHHVNAGHGRRRGGCHRRRRGRSDPGGSTRPWAAILPDLGRPGPAMTDRTATRRGRPPPRTATGHHAEARSPSPRRSTSDIQTATPDHRRRRRPAVRQSCPPQPGAAIWRPQHRPQPDSPARSGDHFGYQPWHPVPGGSTMVKADGLTSLSGPPNVL